MAWLTGWTYRKAVSLSRASGAITDYQMRLLVGESAGATGEDVDCGGKCLSSFADLRFTAADGTTLLNYWIESVSGATPNQLATVWIKFNSIGTDATMFYMYYGNSSASAASNGDNTFIFFDDFSGDFPGTKWTGDTAYYQIVSGQLVNKTTGGVDKIIRSTVNAGVADAAIRVSAKLQGTNTWYFGFFASHAARMYYADTRGLDSFNGTYSTKSIVFSLGSFRIFDLLVRAGVNTAVRENGSEVSGSPKTTNPTNASNMGVYLLSRTPYSSVLTTFNWIAMRKYVNNAAEPVWSAWGEEEDEEEEPVVYALSLDGGSLFINGSSASLLMSRAIQAVSGSVSLAGASANLLRHRLLSADKGTVRMTMTEADMLISGISGLTFEFRKRRSVFTQ